MHAHVYLRTFRRVNLDSLARRIIIIIYNMWVWFAARNPSNDGVAYRYAVGYKAFTIWRWRSLSLPVVWLFADVDVGVLDY